VNNGREMEEVAHWDESAGAGKKGGHLFHRRKRKSKASLEQILESVFGKEND